MGSAVWSRRPWSHTCRHLTALRPLVRTTVRSTHGTYDLRATRRERVLMQRMSEAGKRKPDFTEPRRYDRGFRSHKRKSSFHPLAQRTDWVSPAITWNRNNL